VANLLREGIDPLRIHVVGNTMIDSVNRYLPAALAREPWARLGVEPGDFALVTLHRPALVDDLQLLRRAMDSLLGLAGRLPVIFPVHPRTRMRLADAGVAVGQLIESGVTLCAPLGYLDFLGLEAKAAFVLTDSGGVQEETSALGVRCFTLRDATERPVTTELGTNTLLGADPDLIQSVPQRLKEARPGRAIPLWDGRAGPRVAEVIAVAVRARSVQERRRPASSAGRRPPNWRRV
jgi:UDP-N-acetylglucosamine 2-epimerase (non-hydrolysing)